MSRGRVPEWYDDEGLSGAPGWRERALRARLETLWLIVEGLASRVRDLERGRATTGGCMPFSSEAQRRAMYAAASGRSTLGIPKRAAQKFIRHSRKHSGKRGKRKGRS